MVALKQLVVLILLVIFCNVTYARPYGSILCQNPNFYCHIAKRGDSWEKLFTDPNQRELVMKLNRINTHVFPGMKIAIPKSKDLNILDYSPLPLKISAPGTKIIFVSLQVLAWGAYDENGQLINWGPVSGGRGYCPDTGHGCHTVTGRFEVYAKEGPDCYSTKFPVGRGGAPMPYCMYFHGGFALHGSYEVPGYNDSHGCVRMFVEDAQWLNQEFLADQLHVPVIIQ